MKGLAAAKLRSFKEVSLGCNIRVFGSIAIAVAVCQITENETQVTRGIEMMLLVRTDSRWQIVSRAWDTEGESKPIPADLLDSGWLARCCMARSSDPPRHREFEPIAPQSR